MSCITQRCGCDPFAPWSMAYEHYQIAKTGRASDGTEVSWLRRGAEAVYGTVLIIPIVNYIAMAIERLVRNCFGSSGNAPPTPPPEQNETPHDPIVDPFDSPPVTPTGESPANQFLKVRNKDAGENENGHIEKPKQLIDNHTRSREEQDSV